MSLVIVLALVSTAFAIRRTSVHRRRAHADGRERELQTAPESLREVPVCIEDQL
jgi:hypothetical protein